VLIVEDDELTQLVLVEMCRDLGFESLTAADGYEAIETLKAHADCIHVVLMDIHMPIMSGITAAKSIRALLRGAGRMPALVAITADVHWQNHNLCLENGFDAVLAKPLDIDLLEDALTRLDRLRNSA